MSNYYSITLTEWYKVNKRDLPWRTTTDAYKIWISEIILQQTRVNQGLAYFLRFMERFPTIGDLAISSEDEVLKYWQGLGYYSRARNLHKAARQVMSYHNGKFPNKYNDVIKLAGIGEYTAAAICSFAYHQPYAVVDGNVYRVLARLFGIETPIDSTNGKKEFATMAQEILNISEPHIHNQAIMDFGAMQCIPASPDCNKCPFVEACKAYATKKVTELPIKSKKTKVTHRHFNYLFIQHNENTFLQKRTAKDVWQNLYEFPLIESDHLLSAEELINHKEFNDIFEKIDQVEILKITNPMKHILSHRVIFTQFICIRIKSKNEYLNLLEETPLNDINRHAVSRLMEIFIQSEL